MEQQQDGTEAMERYNEARAWLAFLVDHPDKAVSAAEYRAQIVAASEATAVAHDAWMGAAK
jgi:hypothetical protein